MGSIAIPPYLFGFEYRDDKKRPVFSIELSAMNPAWNLLIIDLTSLLFKYPKIPVIHGEVRMKRLVISCILILALTNQAYAMGSHHGGGRGGGSSASVSSSGSGGSSTGGSDSGTSNTTPNSPTSGNTGAVGGQDSTGGGPIIVGPSSPNSFSTTCVPTPEPTTMFLLGSALLGLWGFRRKIKK